VEYFIKINPSWAIKVEIVVWRVRWGRVWQDGWGTMCTAAVMHV